MRLYSLVIKAALTAAIGLVGHVQAATVVCPNAPIDRFVTVTGAKTGGVLLLPGRQPAKY